MTVFDCSLITLPKIHFPSGSITAVNCGFEVPFDVKRVFYLYDIPGGESRGGHAHRHCHQFLVAASGAFEVLMDDGRVKRQVMLNRPYMGLYVPPGVWTSEVNFSSGSICLVLASHHYSEEDYIREYEDYLTFNCNDPSPGGR